MTYKHKAFLIFLTLIVITHMATKISCQTCATRSYRFDCGHKGTTQKQCKAKGCCWDSSQHGIPYCFAKNAGGRKYIVYNITRISSGIKMTLMHKGPDGPYGAAISPLDVHIEYQIPSRLHIKISDPKSKRWEVPASVSPVPKSESFAEHKKLYKVEYAEIGQPFFFAVIRATTKEVLFNTSNTPLFFNDQYLEISTHLPSNAHLYGLGEHIDPFLISNGTFLTLWNHDIGTPPKVNLYGSHPFLLDVRPHNGNAHGVFLRNSNGMDIIYYNNILTYKLIGGVLDFYFFLGPTANDVVQQYHDVIGRPVMIPYWSLGFHQSRFGYRNVEALETVVKKYYDNNIPLDTIWSDIDYMDKAKDFTLDPINYPLKRMQNFTNTLHDNFQHYVIMTDCGISTSSSYEPYLTGLKNDIFIKDKNGKVFVGRVWPGYTAFPDFLNPASLAYWKQHIQSFREKVKFDGVWIDMNEISNFCNGECHRRSFTNISNTVKADVNSPPYKINNVNKQLPLNTKTLDMDALHYHGILEYDAHNLYGLLEARATHKSLISISSKRPFVLSRSTWPGSGVYTAHWTGDNHATFDDMHNSIIGVLNFQLFGIPMIGSDICGFNGDSNEELCARWMELGAFYPFARNHNTKGAKPQEPYTWKSVASISSQVLSLRYSLLPYYYTLFYQVTTANAEHRTGVVLEPLFFEFPNDINTYSIDKQFLVGPGLLICPVLTKGAKSVKAYFPQGQWYDILTYKLEYGDDHKGSHKTINAPLEKIPVYIRGGVTVPMQRPALTTTATRRNPFKLLIALTSKSTSIGKHYFDDGISLNTTSIFVVYKAFKASGKMIIKSEVTNNGHCCHFYIPPIQNITILGLRSEPKKVLLNGTQIHPSQIEFHKTTATLKLINLDILLQYAFKILFG